MLGTSYSTVFKYRPSYSLLRCVKRHPFCVIIFLSRMSKLFLKSSICEALFNLSLLYQYKIDFCTNFSSFSRSVCAPKSRFQLSPICSFSIWHISWLHDLSLICRSIKEKLGLAGIVRTKCNPFAEIEHRSKN